MRTRGLTAGSALSKEGKKVPGEELARALVAGLSAELDAKRLVSRVRIEPRDNTRHGGNRLEAHGWRASNTGRGMWEAETFA